MPFEEPIQRIIQEYVPGKQITLAHVIANPEPDLGLNLGLAERANNSLGILTITPSEGVIIAADIATKAGQVTIGFLDRTNGSLLLCGDVSSVETALRSVLQYFDDVLRYSSVEMTRS